MYKKNVFYLYISIVLILIVRWYMGYRFIPSDLPHEELIDEISIYSNFTNIAYMLSVYTLLFLFILSINMPLLKDFHCIRCSRKEYVNKGLKTIFYNSLIFVSVLIVLQALFLLIQFQEANYLIQNYYLLGSVLIIILWTISYLIIGLLYYFIYLCTKSKLLGIFLTLFICIGMLSLFRFCHINTLFCEIDVFKNLYYDNFSFSFYVLINLKYTLFIYMMYLLCEKVFIEREIIY